MNPRWYLAIDFGTTQTCAAGWIEGEQPKIIPLGRVGNVMPSAVFERDGDLIVGEDAANALAGDPLRGERTPKRKLRHRSSFIEFDTGRAWSIDEVVGKVLEQAYDIAVAHVGSTPEKVCLTRPVAWAEDGTRDLILQRAFMHPGVREVPTLISESEAAARHLGLSVQPGDCCVAYDLGAGTCDVAVMEMTDDGLAVRGYDDREVGGETFDAILREHVLVGLSEHDSEAAERLRELIDDPLPESIDTLELAWRRCLAQLSGNVKLAKEQLSSTDEVPVLVPPPVNWESRLQAAELERILQDPINETVEAVRDCIARAGVTPSAVYLAGGGSVMPAVRRAVSAATELEATWSEDPKSATALGAVRAIAEPLVEQERDARARERHRVRVAEARERVEARERRRAEERAHIRAEAAALRQRGI